MLSYEAHLVGGCLKSFSIHRSRTGLVGTSREKLAVSLLRVAMKCPSRELFYFPETIVPTVGQGIMKRHFSFCLFNA